jgi:hypothetical protein
MIEYRVVGTKTPRNTSVPLSWRAMVRPWYDRSIVVVVVAVVMIIISLSSLRGLIYYDRCSSNSTQGSSFLMSRQQRAQHHDTPDSTAVAMMSSSMLEDNNARSNAMVVSGIASDTKLTGNQIGLVVVFGQLGPFVKDVAVILILQYMGLPMLVRLSWLVRRIVLFRRFSLFRRTIISSSSSLSSSSMISPVLHSLGRSIRNIIQILTRGWKHILHVYKQTSASKVINRGKRFIKLLLPIVDDHNEQQCDCMEEMMEENVCVNPSVVVDEKTIFSCHT